MKHPTLTRVFAVILAILCFVMLFAGAAGILAAKNENESDWANHARLLNRIDEYALLTETLEGALSYAETKEKLDAYQDEHDDIASQHKTELATYTATRSGLNQGADALWQAQAALDSARAKYNTGLAEFEAQEAAFYEGYNKYLEGKEQLEQGKAQYEQLAALLAGVHQQLDGLKGMALILESDDENARRDLTVAAYDSAISAYIQLTGVVTGLEQQGVLTAEQVQQLESLIVSATGKSSAELLAAAQAERESIASGDAQAPISDEQFDAIKAVYDSVKDQLQAAIAALDSKLAEYDVTLAETKAGLEAAQAEMDKLDSVMAQAKAGIEQGRLALEAAGAQLEAGADMAYENLTLIWYELGKLDDQMLELREQKEQLDAEAIELGEMTQEAKEQKDMEKRQISVGVMLKGYGDVGDRVAAGEEILAAAEDYSNQLQAEFTRNYHVRLWAYVIMIIAGIAGIFGIPAAFEKLKSRAMLIAPVAVCLALAVVAEIVCVLNGRGSTYSAIGVIIFAAIQMLIILPKNKRAITSNM